MTIGLRPGPRSAADARAHGFTEDDGTLGDWLDIAAESDLLILLIAEAALAAQHQEIFAESKPGAVHGMCSRTTRLGVRRWGPRFQAAYEQVAFPASELSADTGLLKAFDEHPVHQALTAAARLRPSVGISAA